MLYDKTNLEIELILEREKSIREEALMNEIKLILAHDDLKRNQIQEKIKTESSTKQNDFIFDLLETNKIFHINQIKKIAVDYRLRFLDSNLFKNEIPDEAVSKIKYLEKNHKTTLDGFKIMAPSKLFHLKNQDDPLLFAPIGNDYYYLIHKWGNDMSPFRKMLVRPFKDLGSIFFSLIVVSFLLAFITPTNILLGSDISLEVYRALSFLFIFKSICGITLYYCFWKGKNFNSEIWNSAYYN